MYRVCFDVKQNVYVCVYHRSASTCIFMCLFIFNPSECIGNYRATSNYMKLVHWPLMGGLLHLVQRGGDWAGPNGQCTKHCIAV